MRLRLPQWIAGSCRARSIFVIAAIAFFLPLRAGAAEVTVCNHGDVSLNTARVVYSQSFFFGNSYRVSGWYVVDPRKCEVIYSSDDPEDLYLGFTYQDSKGTLRMWEPDEDSGDDVVKVVSDTFCAGVGIPYDYTTKTKGASSTSCQNNYSPMEFTMYLALDSGRFGQLEYTLSPHKFSTGGPVFSGPTAAAKLMMGGEVHLSGNSWRTADGTPLSSSMINPQRKLPPLGPKQQYSIARPPVAGYIKQIIDVLSSTQPCHNTYLNEQVSQQGFVMDDRGVAVSSKILSGYKNEREVQAMAIGDMELSKAAPVDRGGCWQLEVYCKDQSYCGQHNNPPDGTATTVFDVFVDSEVKATAVLNALKSMTPYYPDATPEIRQLE